MKTCSTKLKRTKLIWTHVAEIAQKMNVHLSLWTVWWFHIKVVKN